MERVEIIGNLGKDAEVKEFNGEKYTLFNVAVSRKTKDNTITTWYSCFKFGDNPNLLKYLTKGTKLFVRGNLSTKEYESQGGKKFSLNINVSGLEFVGGASEEKKEEPKPAKRDLGDDLPF